MAAISTYTVTACCLHFLASKVLFAERKLISNIASSIQIQVFKQLSVNVGQGLELVCGTLEVRMWDSGTWVCRDSGMWDSGMWGCGTRGRQDLGMWGHAGT